MPARCPSTRGRCRCAAQRPFPSMITARCRGRRPKSICLASPSSADPSGTTERMSSRDMGGNLDDTKEILVRWSAGPLVRWSAGPLVRWSAGPLVRWSAGPLVRWSAGPLVRWSAGPLVQRTKRPSILHTRQEQPLRRRRPAGLRAIERFEDGQQAPGVPSARPDLDERPHDVSDHVPEETIPGDADHERQIEPAAVLEVERVNGPHGAALGGAGPLESGEIMGADQRTRRGRHRFEVERLWNVPDVAAQEHGDDRGVHDPRSEEHTSELQSLAYLVCRLL